MSKPRILLVDDEMGLRVTLAANLELEGFEVVEAASGEEALELAKRSPFDLVVTDIRMPGMSGVDVLHAIRGTSRELPVVLMTGFALEDSVQGALESGAFALLSKPFDVGHMVRVVSNAARRPMVLVVDDAESVARSTALALETVGLKARAAMDAAAAEATVRDGDVDICVVDMVMPDKSGPDVIDALKAKNPGLLVIAMSGHDVPDMIRRVAASGMQTFLKKPFRITELVRAIALARGTRQAA